MAGGGLSGVRGRCGEWLVGKGVVSFIFMHRLQVPVGLHQVLQRDPSADRGICYSWWWNTPDDGQKHFSCDARRPLFGVLGRVRVGRGQRSDGRTLLGAAPGSEIEVDEGDVDLQMIIRG